MMWELLGEGRRLLEDGEWRRQPPASRECLLSDRRSAAPAAGAAAPRAGAGRRLGLAVERLRRARSRSPLVTRS